MEKYKKATTKLNEERIKFDDDITSLGNIFKKQMKDKDLECEEKIKKIEKENKSRLEKANAGYLLKFDEMELEHKDRIKTLDDHINDLRDVDRDVTKLSEAIFNCTTIEEIAEIQRLIETHRIDDVVKHHLNTLQNLFLSLSYGIIPICDSQRRAISDSQRELVDKIQSSNKTSAKKSITEGRTDIINLFSVINDSLKLVRDSFNRYGIQEK